MDARPLTTDERARFRERQLGAMVPRLRLGLLAGAVMFVAFAFWDELARPGAGLGTIPLRAAIAAALVVLSLLLRLSPVRRHPDRVLYATVVLGTSAISLFTTRLPSTGHGAAASLTLLLMLVSLLGPTPSIAAATGVVTLVLANVLCTVGGLPTLDLAAINVFAGSAAVVTVLMARLNERVGQHAFRLELELEAHARTDALCGILNRRAFLESAARVLERARTDATPVSVLLLDLDHFKRVNDTQGHAGGDEALRSVARACERTLRPGDLLCRMGGEELGVMLPGADADAAAHIAERIRAAIEATAIELEGRRFHVTTSIGVATSLPGSESTIAALLHRADLALYAAKAAGRNRVEREPAEARAANA